MRVLVTGGAGFIGSCFVLRWLRHNLGEVINLDLLTYAGNLENLSAILDDPRHIFVQGDICDRDLVRTLLERHQPDAVVHFAAESHVDRSIVGPEAFLHTNVGGTLALLSASRSYYETLPEDKQKSFRFLHVSTDEVYGTLGPEDAPFKETTPFAPNSPYAASKASSDHFARAWFHTYGLPVLITNCSNNYGPRQFPEKLIPLVIRQALRGESLPIYGDGKQVRDWLFVEDHCSAIEAVLRGGRPGETYNIGGGNQQTNLDVVHRICALLDELVPDSPHRPHSSLIRFVQDRPGHDRRYAIDARKIEDELGWKVAESFETGLRKTIVWYLQNEEWMARVTSGAYREWVDANYSQRRETNSIADRAIEVEG